MICPCYSRKNYKDCCETFHNGKKNAPTAEALMRSRYSAFAIPNGKYLYKTTHPTQRKFHPQNEYQNWAEENTWTKLEILATPNSKKVEFKAYFTDKDNEKQVHHELSTFEKIQNQWFYVTGEFLD